MMMTRPSSRSVRMLFAAGSLTVALVECQTCTSSHSKCRGAPS